jgi:prevent-host-death family protein
MTTTVGAFEAKTRLAELLAQVSKGERITITKHGTAVAQLVPADERVAVNIEELREAFARIRAATRPGGTIRELRDEGRRL